jgi:hypothetical protein
MKHLFLFIFVLITAHVSAADIIILFDFEPKFEDVQRMLASNKLLRQKKRDIRIFFLGDLSKEFRLADYKEGVEWNFESPSCDFIEKVDLQNFIEKYGFDEIYYKEGKEILNDIGYLRNASDLVYLSSDVVKSKKKILILNLIVPKYPFVPDFNISVSEGDYYIGDYVEAKIDFYDKNKFLDCEISWSVNGAVLKSSAESVRIKLNSEKNEISCLISYKGSSCSKPRSTAVRASLCTGKIPYEMLLDDLYFTQPSADSEDDTRFVQLTNISNLGNTYPGSIWILPVIFNCPIREFKIQFSDSQSFINILNDHPSDVQIGKTGGGESVYSLDKIYDVKDKNQRTFSELGSFYFEKITGQMKKSDNLELIIINGLTDKLKYKSIYFRLIPTSGNYNESLLTKYKISFNTCSDLQN